MLHRSLLLRSYTLRGDRLTPQGCTDHKLFYMSLRQDLESDDTGRQSMALLQLLSLLAAGRESSGLVTAACQAVLGRPTASATRRLAYNVVRTASLSSDDWDAVCEAVKADIGGGLNPEVIPHVC